MSITRTFKGLFWSPEGGVADARGGAALEEVPDAALAVLAAKAAAQDGARAANVTAPPAGPASSAAVTGDDAPGVVDFAAIYATTNTTGDPRVDQVLTAFEAMKAAMPGPQLAIAVGATAKAIGADPASIVATLTQRLSALDTALADQRRKAAEREAARTAELEAITKQVETEISAMEHKITTLRRQLGAATERVQHRTAGERGVIATFDARARGEADRLKALRDFLAPPGTAPAGPTRPIKLDRP